MQSISAHGWIPFRYKLPRLYEEYCDLVSKEISKTGSLDILGDIDSSVYFLNKAIDLSGCTASIDPDSHIIDIEFSSEESLSMFLIKWG